MTPTQILNSAHNTPCTDGDICGEGAHCPPLRGETISLASLLAILEATPPWVKPFVSLREQGAADGWNQALDHIRSALVGTAAPDHG